MIKSYFKIALRNLLKTKIYSVINILGLSLGVAAVILLSLYVNNELRYDMFHKNVKKIYRIGEEKQKSGKTDNFYASKTLLLPKLLEDYPGIVNGSRIFNHGYRINYKTKSFNEDVIFVDKGFFEMFSFKFLFGHAKNALADKNSIVISQKMAVKYFGDENPVGKVLDFDYGANQLVVACVIDDIQDNSSIKFDFAARYQKALDIIEWFKPSNDWYNTFMVTYIQLAKNETPQNLESQFPKLVDNYFLTGGSETTKLVLLPLEKLHFETTDHKSNIYILSCITIGILLIAAMNFINLSTARSITRAKEVGVRKALGARKVQLLSQFLGESYMVTFFAIPIGTGITELILPAFNNIFETEITFNYNDISTLLMLLILGAFLGFLSGYIPAIILTKFDCVKSLKSQLNFKTGGISLRNMLVLFQFVLSIILISGSLIIWKQLDFMKNHDLNFDNKNVLTVLCNPWNYQDKETAARKLEIIKTELEQDSRIILAALSSDVPGRYPISYNQYFPEKWDDKEPLSLRQTRVGQNYFNTFGIEFVEGRDFSEEIASDNQAVIINEAARKAMGLTSAVDHVLHVSFKDGRTLRIVGVVKDFHYHGLQYPVEPLIHSFPGKNDVKSFMYLSMKIADGKIPEVLKVLKEKWDKANLSEYFNYFFANDEINKQYKAQERISTVVLSFTVLGIFLACLGLLGLASFTTIRRTKEIGIRKALGAKADDIVILLSKEFLRWVVFANIIALPISYYLADLWLRDFAYRINMGWVTFIISGSLALSIAFFTVGYHSFKAALTNPAESLRTE